MIEANKGVIKFRGDADTVVAEMGCVVAAVIDRLVDDGMERADAVNLVKEVCADAFVESEKSAEKKGSVLKLETKEAIKELLKMLEEDLNG